MYINTYIFIYIIAAVFSAAYFTGVYQVLMLALLFAPQASKSKSTDDEETVYEIPTLLLMLLLVIAGVLWPIAWIIYFTFKNRLVIEMEKKR